MLWSWYRSPHVVFYVFSICIKSLLPEICKWFYNCFLVTKLLGVYWFQSIHLSVRPSIRPYVCPASCGCFVMPAVLVGSISYLYILSGNFRRFVAYNVSCKKFKNLNFGQFFEIFNLVLFWLGIWCESLVWVIMGRQGISQNAGVLVVPVNLGIYIFSTSHEISLRWIPLYPIDNKSPFVQAMAWFHLAATNYLNQCWPISIFAILGHWSTMS